jgi:hypothetical protein
MSEGKRQEPETDELAPIEWTDEPWLVPGEVELDENGEPAVIGVPGGLVLVATRWPTTP